MDRPYLISQEKIFLSNIQKGGAFLATLLHYSQYFAILFGNSGALIARCRFKIESPKDILHKQ